jgi:hypothetical protein
VPVGSGVLFLSPSERARPLRSAILLGLTLRPVSGRQLEDKLSLTCSTQSRQKSIRFEPSERGELTRVQHSRAAVDRLCAHVRGTPS